MKPVVVSTEEALRQAVAAARRERKTIGLVPTMGALHAGHVSLIDAARAADGFVVVSIFVNPTQFGPNEDFPRYPRPLERDLKFCASAGVDLVFTPDAATMYPPGSRTVVEVKELSEVLEGAVTAGPLPRRGDGGAEAVQPRAAGSRLLRPEGRPAGARHPADGARPERAGGGGRAADGARAGRAGAQLAQPVS